MEVVVKSLKRYAADSDDNGKWRFLVGKLAGGHVLKGA